MKTDESKAQGGIDLLKTVMEEATPDPAQEGITWKRCGRDGCEAIFYRDKESDATWSKKLYCNPKCGKKVENMRKIKRRANAKITNSAAYTPEKAQAVAIEKWEDLAQVLSVFVDDVKTLDALRATCTKIGADCYKQCAQDMGVAV